MLRLKLSVSAAAHERRVLFAVQESSTVAELRAQLAERYAGADAAVSLSVDGYELAEDQSIAALLRDLDHVE